MAMSTEGPSYWATGRRLSRRRVLVGGAGAVGVVGLGLAGCTASTETPVATSAAAVGTAPPAGTPSAGAAPTTRRAPKYGGIVRTSSSSVERNLDPQQLNGGHGSHGASACYNQLLTFKWGPGVAVPSYIVTGDLAESWTQPDETTYIFKMRPGVKWQNIAPVNGREFVADDVLYSYDRIRELKAYAPLLSGVIKQEAPDKSTVRLTLDKPNPDLLTNLSSYYMKIVAREAVAVNGHLENGPTIGTGPWIQDEYVAGQRFSGKRNPDYFMKGTPYCDKFESLRFTSGDSSLNTNAVRSGNLDIIGGTPDVADDVLKTNPNTKLLYVPLDRSGDEVVLNTNYAPFKNKKVRQA